MKTYSFTLAAATPILLPFGGRQFFLMEAVYPVDVEFFDANNQNAGEKLEAIPAGSWAEPDRGFSSLRLTSATAQTVKFIISTGRAGVFRIAGDVSVVEGGKARTIAGQAFCGQVGAGPAGAAYSHAQLLNPIGSAIRAMVEQIIVTADTAGAIQLFEHDAALTTLAGGAPSKLIGGAASVCELRSQTNATLLGAAGTNYVLERVQANITPPVIVFAEPLVLRPGRGLLVLHGTVSIGLNASFEFFEEPNT